MIIKTFKTIHSISFLLFSVFSFSQLETQLIGGEGWAKGNFVEIGINSKGVYGAQTANRPATFHDNRDIDLNGLFGFIANPQADGWVDYDGDYFTPGSPEEGFGIQVDGLFFNNNNEGGTNQIPGNVTGTEIISSDCFDDIAQITWEGNVTGLNIRRFYSITEDGLFIQMMTFIENTSSVNKRDIYWMHNVDPDNNQSLSGLYETNMELISQASSIDDNICLVSASQDALSTPLDMDGSTVSLYARDARARVTFGGFNNRVPIDVWTGAGFFSNNEGDTAYVDDAISIAFNLGDLAPGATTSFVYYYILEEVDESFVPFIVNIIPENTTTCGGSDGRLVITGLTAGEDFTISYFDDGILIPDTIYTSDADGNIIISGLDAGTYTDFTISLNSCVTSVDNNFVITDPQVPDFLVTKTDLSRCDIENGSIQLTNMIADVDYTISYTKVGEPEVTGTYTSDSSGIITIDNLGVGTYTGFIAEIYNCTVTNDDSLTLLIPNDPIANPIPDQLYCDDDYDYIIEIGDLESLDTFVLGAQNPADFDITYHLTEQDAIDNIVLDDPYTTSGADTFLLYARITNSATRCFSYVSFTNIISIPPVFDLNDGSICFDSNGNPNPDYPLPTLDTNLSEAIYDFQWYKDGVLIPTATSSELTVSETGTYSVNVIHEITTCNITKDALVTGSGTPEVLEVTVTTPPFSENPTVEIIATGLGDYEYKVDNGPYQDSPIFQNLSPGYHTFCINDKNGCGEVCVERFIIDYPIFFTPNDDGYNDTWQIIGIERLINPEIFIFDRYGKLLKQLSPQSGGWDGTFNGQKMPSDDYWFKIIFDHGTSLNRREFRSHFALKH